MVAIIIIGILIAAPAWYIYIRAPNWILWGVPSYIEPIIELIRVPNDFMGLQTIHQLREYSLIAGIIGALLIVVPILASKRR